MTVGGGVYQKRVGERRVVGDYQRRAVERHFRLAGDFYSVNEIGEYEKCEAQKEVGKQLYYKDRGDYG